MILEDIGRHYEAIIRVNSQSGKARAVGVLRVRWSPKQNNQGGIAYILEQEYGIALPKEHARIIAHPRMHCCKWPLINPLFPLRGIQVTERCCVP